MTDALAGKAVDVLYDLITTAIKLVDEYKNAPSSAEALKAHCKEIQDLLEPFQGSDSLPADGVIKNIKDQIKNVTDSIKDYNEKRKKYSEGPFLKRSVYFIKLVYHSVNYNQQFNDYTNQMNDLVIRLDTALRLTKELLEPSSLPYENEMLDKKYATFWRSICGSKIHNDKTSWPLFISKYQQEFKVMLDLELKQRIKSAALVEGDVLTIFGYMQLTNKCGLPIEKGKLPPLLDCNATIPSRDLIKVSEIVSNLIKDFSTDDMNNFIVTVIQWYNDPKGVNNKGKKKQDHDDDDEGEKERKRKERADECYQIIKEVRDKMKDEGQFTDEEKHAYEVEKARRHVCYFYQRFMALCEIGQLSREVFKKVDFPGKNRMESFIRLYQPLDHANYHIVMKGKNWSNKKPKVYDFLNAFIAEIKNDNEKKQAEENKKKEDESGDAITEIEQDNNINKEGEEE